MGAVETKKGIDWKWLVGISMPVIIVTVAFGWNSIKSWGSNKADEALNNQRLCHKVDSICSDGIDKQKQINEINIEIDDFKETVVDYIERQEKRDIRQQEDVRLLIKIADKTNKKVGAATDLIEEIKDKQEQVNNTLNQ